MAKDESSKTHVNEGASSQKGGDYQLIIDAETFIAQAAMASRDVLNGSISPQQAKAGAILMERIENMVRLQLRRESESGKLGDQARGAGSARFLLDSGEKSGNPKR
jgi:hypothetical protein